MEALLGVGVGVGVGLGVGLGVGVGVGVGLGVGSGVGLGVGCGSGVGMGVTLLLLLLSLWLLPESSGFGSGITWALSFCLCLLSTIKLAWLEELLDESVETRLDLLQPETAMLQTSKAISVLFMMRSVRKVGLKNIKFTFYINPFAVQIGSLKTAKML